MHLVEYAIKYSGKTFKELPFNEVDALVFAQLAYYDYSVFHAEEITFKEILNNPNILKATDLKNLIGKEDEKLFNVVVDSRRYRDVKVYFHVKDTNVEKVQQFSATTFEISKDLVVIAFRGTDGTVVGWHEDLNMTYMFPIPCQAAAQKYINKVLKTVKGKAIVVGHSKGGNVAVYASVMANAKEREKIKAVYNFDGPGFTQAFYDLDAYKSISNKLYKFIPPQSTVGKMMKITNDYKVVQSDAKYMMQHWAHTWLIDGTHFAYESSTDFFSETMEDSTDSVLQNMTKDERREAVTLMFEILDKTGCEYMEDIPKNKDNIVLCLKEYAQLKDRKENIKKLAMELLKPIVRNYADKEYSAAKDLFIEKKNLVIDKVKNYLRKD